MKKWTMGDGVLVVVTVLLPYAVRLPGGREWLEQYTTLNMGGVLLLQLSNSMAWATLLVLKRQTSSHGWWILPVLSCLGLMAYGHYSLDLLEDAQNAVALFMIPFYAAGLALVTALAVWLVRRIFRLGRTGGRT